MRRRTRARELALQFLYSLDVRGPEILDDLDDFLRDSGASRLASFELMHCPEIPIGVALNEAIELGKRYSTAQSGAFVNGILDQVKARRPFAAEPAQPPADHEEEEEESPPAEAATP